MMSRDDIHEMITDKRIKLAEAIGKKHAKARNHAPLTVGQKVFMQDPISKLWSRVGEVVRIRPSGSFIVSSGGKTFIRSRRLLRPCVSDNKGDKNVKEKDSESSSKKPTQSADSDTKTAAPRRSPRLIRFCGKVDVSHIY